MNRRRELSVWLLIAALHAPVGAVAFLAPDFFTGQVASFGASGAHYARDLGAAQVVLGGAAAAAAFRPDLRRSVTALLAVHPVLHALSHLLDAGLGTTSSSVSVLIALVVEAVLLAFAAVGLNRRAQSATTEASDSDRAYE